MVSEKGKYQKERKKSDRSRRRRVGGKYQSLTDPRLARSLRNMRRETQAEEGWGGWVGRWCVHALLPATHKIKQPRNRKDGPDDNIHGRYRERLLDEQGTTNNPPDTHAHVEARSMHRNGRTCALPC